MTTLINNQPVYVERLVTPQVTDINTTPSIDPLVGSLAYDIADPSSIYVGNGTSWNKISSSGSTGGTINGATLNNCTIDTSFIRTNNKISTATEVGCPTFADPGHTFNSAASVVRNINILDTSGTMVFESATQNITNKDIDSATNTLKLNGTNINSLINQDVRTTANPSFVSLKLAPIDSIQEVTITKPDAGAAQLRIEGGGIATIKDGVYDVVGSNLAQTITNKTVSFPTGGGTPSLLDFYEVYNGSITWSGIWASSQTANVTYVRLGNMVTVYFARAIATANTSSQITSDAIPARFRPSVVAQYPIWGITNDVGVTPYCSYDSGNTRWIVMESAGKAASGSGWVGVGTSGVLESGFTYLI